jgi:hypothetical protein
MSLMALCGEGAVCIWNDITPEAEADFYAWHIEEHMPERVGIAGFLRGRRYIAVDAATSPRFFTLYETLTPEVLVGADYLNRLNAPTPWTSRATTGFRNTYRALTRVRASIGRGPGGTLAALRLTLPADQQDGVTDALATRLLPAIARRALITGAHLCTTNMEASAGRTIESKDRSDILTPPNTVVMIEGCASDPLASAMDDLLRELHVERGSPAIGLYRLEYTRLKTDHAPG